MAELPKVWMTGNKTPWDPDVLNEAQNQERVIACYTDGDEIEYRVIFAEFEEMDRCAKRILEQQTSVRVMRSIFGVLALMSGIYQAASKVVSSVTKPSPVDYEKYRKRLLWLPLETVKKTFARTTQLAMNVPQRYPMRRHMMSRTPQLNTRRIAETFCTNTLFGSQKAYGGITCGQLFVGKESRYTSVHGMKTESEGPDSFEDFIRDKGAPSCIRSDNSKMQTGHEWRRLMRKYNICLLYTSPSPRDLSTSRMPSSA